MSALLQDPAPARLYAAVAAKDGAGVVDYASALASLSALNVNFVTLAEEFDVGVAGPPATNLVALKSHVESLSADGKPRLGVAMVDRALAVAQGETFPANAETAYAALKSDVSRMVLVAGRPDLVLKKDNVVIPNPNLDLASATAACIAGYQPHISPLLKQVRGVKMPIEKQFGPSEVTQLSERNMIPVFDPELISGEGFHLGAARCYTTDESKLYIDLIRVLDDVEFRLKRGLIGAIGNVRIDRLGMQTLTGRITSILSPLKRRRVISDFSMYVPLLPILEKEEAARAADEATQLANSRTSRRVEAVVSITYGPAIHVLNVNVALKA